MTPSAAASKLVLVADPRKSGRVVRRYRLARLALGPAAPDGRYEYLKSMYD
jgi:hypothetical protein